MILVPARKIQVGKVYFAEIRRKMWLVKVINTKRNRYAVCKLGGKKLPKFRTIKDFWVRDRYHADYVRLYLIDD